MAKKTTVIAEPESAVNVTPSDDLPNTEPNTEPNTGPKTGPKTGVPKKSAGFLPGVALGILAASAGFAAAQFFAFTTAPDLTPIQAEIAALRSQIATLPDPETRLTALELAVNSALPDADKLNARIAALENRPDSAALMLRMQQDISAMQQLSKPFDPTPAVKSAIAAEMLAVQKSATQMRDQGLAAAEMAQRTATLALLRAALDTGAPYASAKGMADLPAILADHADTGLPSLMALKDSFPEAARQGLEAALRANMGGTWAERVTNFLRAQTGARALTPRDGNDPDAILSRAEAALKNADLATVLIEIQSLPPEAQTAMQDWTANTTLRQSALMALAALDAKKE